MSERWESSSDFNGNLGLAERLVNSIIALFPCPICIVSKGSDPDGHKLSCPSYGGAGSASGTWLELLGYRLIPRC